MKRRDRSISLLVSLFGAPLCLIGALLFLDSCTPGAQKKVSSPQGAPGQSEQRGFSLTPGPDPRWFEVGTNGPVAISSPDQASLVPFTPWPLARRIVGMVVQDDRIVASVNQEGFLTFQGGTEAGDTGPLRLTWVSEGDVWSHYSVGTVFSYLGNPSVFLYRDHFFTDPTVPVLRYPVRSLVPGAPGLKTLDLAFLRGLGTAEGWEADSLVAGSDGRWFLRSGRTVKNAGERRFLVAPSLDSPGIETNQGAFRNAQLPCPLSQAPEALQLAIVSAYDIIGPNRRAVAMVIGKNYDSARSFFADPQSNASGSLGTSTENILQLWGVADKNVGFLLFPDGVCVKAETHGKDRDSAERFTLPSLPQNFVYTGVAILGERIIASWEEQDSWAVGAAGFVVIF